MSDLELSAGDIMRVKKSWFLEPDFWLMSGAEFKSFSDLFLGFPAGSGLGEVNMGVEEIDVYIIS